MTTIHFICRGNTFRSRLAQAYARSLLDPSDHTVLVISSGIAANDPGTVELSPWTTQILQQANLYHFVDANKVQTTQELIDQSQVLVFLNQDVYNDAKLAFKLPVEGVQVWQVPDKGESALDTDAIFDLIKTNVDGLMQPYMLKQT